MAVAVTGHCDPKLLRDCICFETSCLGTVCWVRKSEPRRGGRPRSERARTAVLHAVDDLLLEVGYAEMTMKGIAERAGVGRQTVYRWWSTKAEILLEASVQDAAQELDVETVGAPVDVLTAYLQALIRFLVVSPAGIAFRALIGEAQHDPAVATLLSTRDVLGDSARVVVQHALGQRPLPVHLDEISAQLVGPTFFWILGGRNPAQLDPRVLAEMFLRQINDQSAARTAPG